jgi:hypothetical protein
MSSARDQLEPAAWALFLALRPRPTEADRATLAGASREEWRRIGQLSLQTFSAPLAYARLRASGLLGSAPDEVQERLGRVYAWNLARNARVLAQVREATDALAEAGIAPLVLKGAHLARLYAQPGARTMGDVDLLVRRPALDAARAVLLGLGYRCDAPSVEVAHHLAPFRRADGVPIELHGSLGEGADEPGWQAGVWERAGPLPGERGLAMEPVDALLFACRHLAVHHGFSTTNALAGLADVALLAEQGVDWDALAARAAQWELAPGAFLCLVLARDLLGAPVPEGLLARLEVPGWEPALASALWTMLHVGGLGATRDLLLPARATLNPPPPASSVLGPAPVTAAIRWLRQAALPPVDDVALEYRRLRSRPWCYLAYPLHWSRLAYTHAGLVRLARRSVREAHRQRFLEQRRVIAAFLGSARQPPEPPPDAPARPVR